MSRPVFNRPVEYDPSLFRSSQLLAQQQPPSRPVSREQAMKNEFGFDAEEEKTGGSGEIGGAEESISRIQRVEDEDDAAADEEELERLAEQVQAAREAQMVRSSGRCKTLQPAKKSSRAPPGCHHSPCHPLCCAVL